MTKSYTLEYWPDEGGFVGRLREVPGVFSQGESLIDLETNIRDAFDLLFEDEPPFLIREYSRLFAVSPSR